MKPLVSIVTACWNQAEFLDDAIRSALSQSYDHWEMWIIDDGSTDDPASVAEAYRFDARIRFVRFEHRGQSFTKSLGVRLSHGEWIAFLDADDVWEPQKLERQLAYEEADPNASILWTGRYLIVDGERRPHVSNDNEVTRDSLFERNPICFSSTMIRREVFEQIGLFHPTIDRSIDYDLWLRAAVSYRFGYIDEALVGYRTGHANLSADKVERMKAVIRISEEQIHRKGLQPRKRIRTNSRSSTYRNLGYYLRHNDRLAALRAYWKAFRCDRHPYRLARSIAGMFIKAIMRK